MKQLLLAFLLLCMMNCLTAQMVDNTSTFKNINSNKYFRFTYENDFFTATDNYYTQGIKLELVSPALKKFPIQKLLFKFSATEIKYGITADQFAYTPSTLRSDTILHNDRPYAACLSFKTFSIAVDTIKKTRVTNALVVGLIGPGAGGEEMQTGIHKWLNNPLPLGWQYQIQNDLILNYQLNVEKALVTYDNNFLLNSTAEIRLGTLNDKVSGGFNFMMGNFISPYSTANNTKRKKISWYFFGQTQINLIAYDASMQGGLFNHNSPNIIAGRDITRATFQIDDGIAINFNKVHIEYAQTFLTKEFRAGSQHRWGGIMIGIEL